jgi:hypothetical protein
VAQQAPQASGRSKLPEATQLTQLLVGALDFAQLSVLVSNLILLLDFERLE